MRDRPLEVIFTACAVEGGPPADVENVRPAGVAARMSLGLTVRFTGILRLLVASGLTREIPVEYVPTARLVGSTVTEIEPDVAPEVGEIVTQLALVFAENDNGGPPK